MRSQVYPAEWSSSKQGPICVHDCLLRTNQGRPQSFLLDRLHDTFCRWELIFLWKKARLYILVMCWQKFLEKPLRQKILPEGCLEWPNCLKQESPRSMPWSRKLMERCL